LPKEDSKPATQPVSPAEKAIVHVTSSPNGIDQIQAGTPVPASSGPVSGVAPNTSAVGTIYVHSNPDSAEVYLDGSLVGDTPATLKLNPGQHTIRVVLTGYKEWSRELSVQAGLEAHLAANLQNNEPANEMKTSNPTTLPEKGKSALVEVSANSPQNSIGWIGVHAQNGGDAAVVTNVPPDSPGAKAGLQVGDIILALDGRLVKGKDFETAVAALKPGTRIPINYARGSTAHEVWLTVGSKQ
jgi:membrane-associated protease RseP (regulator of RpoE activity)